MILFVASFLPVAKVQADTGPLLQLNQPVSVSPGMLFFLLLGSRPRTSALAEDQDGSVLRTGVLPSAPTSLWLHSSC